MNEHELMRRVRALPRSVPPPTDLWPEIEAVIRAAQRPATASPRGAGARAVSRWPWQGWAAAAVLVGAVALLAGWWTGIGNPARSPSPATVSPATWAEFQAAEDAYQRVSDDLLRALEARRDELSPETLRAVQDSLRQINEAILQAKTALARDPDNAKLATTLTGIYRKRLHLLQDLTGL